jgi:hypothetical protein
MAEVTVSSISLPAATSRHYGVPLVRIPRVAVLHRSYYSYE